MSDQDFFFDDETEFDAVDEKPAKDAKSKKSDKPAVKKAAPVKKSTKSASAADGGFEFTTVVVVLIAVIALLVGFLAGILVGNSMSTPSLGTTNPNNQGTIPMGGGGNAPTLSDEQMQQGMPEGHPNVDSGEDQEAPADGGATPEGETAPAEGQ